MKLSERYMGTHTAMFKVFWYTKFGNIVLQKLDIVETLFPFLMKESSLFRNNTNLMEEIAFT